MVDERWPMTGDLMRERDAGNIVEPVVSMRGATMKVCCVFLVLMFGLAGCGTTRAIRGRYVDAQGRGIPGAKVSLWQTSIGMYLAPLLPARVGEGRTDVDGRFEVVPTASADVLNVEGGGGRSAARLWPWSRDLLLTKQPYPPHNYAELNRGCAHSSDAAVSVTVRGAVAKPGQYVLKASDSAWTAIAAAGGPTSATLADVTLTRRFGGGVSIHYLDWARRAEAIGQPLLCDGDELDVGRSILTSPIGPAVGTSR